jgi:hypothetical protein
MGLRCGSLPLHARRNGCKLPLDRYAGPRPNRQPFDLGTFLAPMLVSPIVFIPLLSAFQSIDVDLANLATPKLMIFLVTFENGFFWKAFFDNRRREQKV